MVNNPKILVFAGSARAGSFNKKLAAIAARFASEAKANVTLVDLADHRLPMYDGDHEASQGIPEEVKALRKVFMAQDGFIMVSPEYNSSISPLLKNTIDWVSRADANDPQLVAFRGKVAGLLATSPGALGGLRGLVHLRSILANIGMHVVPHQHAIPAAHDALAYDSSLAEGNHAAAVKSVAEATVCLAAALKE